MKNFKNLRGIWMMWGLVLFAVLVTQCKKEDGPDLKAPQLTVNGASSITRTSAVLSGTVISNGNNISECGFLYSTSQNDLKVSDSNAKKVTASAKTGDVNATIQGLDAGVTYYFCLFVIYVV